MARDVSHLGNDLKKRAVAMEHAIDRGARVVTLAGAKAGKVSQEAVMATDSGGDRRLSRVRSGRGAKIGARYRLRDDTADVFATGPLPLIANPTKAHRIPRFAGRQRVIAIPGIGVRVSAMHPGTKGKDTWDRGREQAEPRITAAVSRKSDEVMRKAFTAGG